MAYIIGIDYGSRKCGIARADTETHIATPVAVVETSSLVEYLVRMNGDTPIERVVFGHSKDLAGNDNPIMESVRVASDEVATALQVPVLFHDERFSSAEAATHLNQLNANRGRKERQQFELDAGAATIILQSFLDSYDKGTD